MSIASQHNLNVPSTLDRDASKLFQLLCLSTKFLLASQNLLLARCITQQGTLTQRGTIEANQGYF